MPAESPTRLAYGNATVIDIGTDVIYIDNPQDCTKLHVGKKNKPKVGSSDTRTKRPRTYGDNVHENLLIEDQDRAKRKHYESMDWESQPSIILGLPKIKRIRVASLCPPLKCRFIHPGGE